MPCFHWLFTKRQMSIRTAEVRLFIIFLCFGRGTSVARRDHGGGLALLESSRGYCRSWYDAEITRNRQWRQRITQDLPDASKMYDWNINIYIYIHKNLKIYKSYIYIFSDFCIKMRVLKIKEYLPKRFLKILFSNCLICDIVWYVNEKQVI